jgi:hypothetical protein
MSEVESQLADLETYVKKQTRYSERVTLICFLGTLACCSVPVGSKYSADHDVQWLPSVRSPGANDSPSNRALDLVRPAEMSKSTPPQLQC